MKRKLPMRSRAVKQGPAQRFGAAARHVGALVLAVRRHPPWGGGAFRRSPPGRSSPIRPGGGATRHRVGSGSWHDGAGTRPAARRGLAPGTPASGRGNPGARAGRPAIASCYTGGWLYLLLQNRIMTRRAGTARPRWGQGLWSMALLFHGFSPALKLAAIPDPRMIIARIGLGWLRS